jgi:adenylylsulfate kinase-like enzyme
MSLTNSAETGTASNTVQANPAIEGRVFWITGLSGAGKTTVASLLVERLRSHGIPTIFLDGDRLRAAFAPDAGHAMAERQKLAGSYARLCGELAGQGFIVVCATVSLFQSVRDWSRSEVPGYREIFLNVPLEEIRARDPKGIYKNVKSDIVGVDIQPEFPASPDITIDNYGACRPDTACGLIWTGLIAADAVFAPYLSK